MPHQINVHFHLLLSSSALSLKRLSCRFVSFPLVDFTNRLCLGLLLCAPSFRFTPRLSQWFGCSICAVDDDACLICNETNMYTQKALEQWKVVAIQINTDTNSFYTWDKIHKRNEPTEVRSNANTIWIISRVQRVQVWPRKRYCVRECLCTRLVCVCYCFFGWGEEMPCVFSVCGWMDMLQSNIYYECSVLQMIALWFIRLNFGAALIFAQLHYMPNTNTIFYLGFVVSQRQRHELECVCALCIQVNRTWENIRTATRNHPTNNHIKHFWRKATDFRTHTHTHTRCRIPWDVRRVRSVGQTGR